MKPARHYLKLRPRFWTRVSAGIAGFIVLQGFVVQPSSAEQAIRSGLQYVELAEKAGLSAEAEQFYELALEADPTLEAAHFGLAQIWISRKELVKSLQVLDRGLESNAGSVRLLLLKVDLLSQLDRELEARHALEEAFRRCPNDPEVVARIAFMRDVHGDRAGETYETLAGVVARDGSNPSAVKAALERGLVVSLRDGERARAVKFGQRLRELGSRDIPDLSSSEPLASHRKTIVVPGGMKAVALAALMQEDVSVERFVGEYASTIARHTRGRDRTPREAYLNGVRNYFQTLSSLKAAGRADGDCTEIVLSSEKPAIENTERVLKLFGWRMKRSGRKIVLEVGTNDSDAVHQPYLSALGVDEVQMKSALENGTPFVLRIVDQRVPVIFDEKVWLERVLEMPGFRSGLLEAMLENPAVARLYSSLTAMNDEAQLLVLRVAEPKQLLDRYSDLLAAYGAALSVVNGRILLPGGDNAAQVWRQFVGSSREDPHAFIASLFARDDGKGLAFFNLLTNLPPLQQRFFTKSAGRLNSFYKAFPFTEKEDLKRHAVVRRDVSFRNLAYELPLDDAGNIRFPGSIQIWVDAKECSSIGEQVPKQLRDASTKVLPDIEDDVLLRLLDTQCSMNGAKFRQVDNFLALVRLEQHRKQPLDEASARLLSQNYARYRELFPLFAALPDLAFHDFRLLFEACRNLESLDRRLLNVAMGEFQAMLQIVSLLFENGALQDSSAAAAITSICDLFAKAKEPSHFAQSTLHSLQYLLNKLEPSKHATHPFLSEGTVAAVPAMEDEKLLAALTGSAERISFHLQDREFAIDRASQQREKMREVLSLQVATPLNTLLGIYTATSRLLQPQADRLRCIEAIESAIPQLKEVDARSQRKLNARVREAMTFGQPEELRDLSSKLRKAAGKEIPRKLSEIATELLGQLNPYLKNSLVAWVYAYYFSPQDLLIAEDTLLVRRHQFVDDDLHCKNPWPSVSQRTHPNEPGTFISGVLFQLGSMAGRMGLTQVQADNSFNGRSTVEESANTQIACLRSLPWGKLSQRDVHTVGVVLRFAREVVATAALRPALAGEVGRLTLGLIGLVRRTQLLNALANHDIEGALSLLSSSDLYFLGERFWLKLGEETLGESPMTLAMQQVHRARAGASADYFGGPHLKTFGCVHNHLPSFRPYEDYENFTLGDAMSERLGHFLLNLAESLDRLGMPIEALAVIGEPAIREFARNSRMNNRDDWMAVLEGAAQVRIPELVFAAQK